MQLEKQRRSNNSILDASFFCEFKTAIEIAYFRNSKEKKINSIFYTCQKKPKTTNKVTITEIFLR